MKIRMGFVSNSSSSSFIITNTTTKLKTILDLAAELQKELRAVGGDYKKYVRGLGEYMKHLDVELIEFWPYEPKVLRFRSNDDDFSFIMYNEVVNGITTDSFDIKKEG